MPAPNPPVIPEAFAQDGDRATIPPISGFTGRADWKNGFPEITMEAKIAGGIPPDGRDFNGVLYAVSAHAFYTQAGQPFVYSSDVSTAISGYGLGAVIGSVDAKTLWYNILADNTADPDVAGTGWVSAFTYGSITISGLTGGTRTLTRLESRFKLIVLTGLLVANQAVVMPNDVTDWRIVNNTTGAFTVTVRTAAGTGVDVPQGGYTAAVGIYGNGTDIFLGVQPVALPIAVTPDPNTLIMRDNVGRAFVTYLNGSAPPETVTVANVIVTNNANGYFRKQAVGDFTTQIFTDAALTGDPTAPTQLGSDNSTKIATTAFVQGFGLGGSAQTYHNVTGSRSAATNYTNGTGKPIFVLVNTSVGQTGLVTAYVDGNPIAEYSISTSNSRMTLSFIVPAGSTYKLDHVGGAFFAINSWYELS